MVVEGTDKGSVHLHALLNVEHLPINAVKSAWQGGQSKVETYDSSRGWSYYISKDLIQDATEWDADFRPENPTGGNQPV